MTPDDIEALTFDVFGTVVDWRSGIMRESAAVGTRHGFAVDWAQFADAWRGRYQPLLSDVRDGRRPWVPLDQLHREGLEQVLAQFGIAGLGEAELVDFVRAWHRLDPWPDAVAGLERLRRRYVLATLSNGNVRLMVNMAKRAGLPWDAVLGAEVARAYKPSPETYLTAARMLDLPPARCMMVAAHYYDLTAAQSLGFRTCYVWRRDEWGTGEKHDLPADHGLDLVVEDFGELADRLGL
ncbi:MAG TPA: haloacid dehalogenase type II [Aliidongia sp.]|uniref:haloacid dehalogenase type II n=1 Tax=Aliidongia sp. TaxID=1914230 RepID=UPI002DDC9E02|nr:haloacid dehalogenase type II [Aliidongia sp.]HEV2674444.1 haloacid dehalogenase type II [Aliidongia sp.]